MDQEHKFKIMNDARMASVLESNFGDLIQSRRETELSKMKQSFRSGKTDQATLSSHIAALCVLDDLESDVKQRIRRAHNLKEET